MGLLAVGEAGLQLAFEDTGPPGGAPLLLLHGWPDDATTWDGVARRLNEAGFRTVIPTHRGFGASVFTLRSALRTGDTGVLCLDAIALMNGLGIARFSVAGHDWGSNMAEAIAAGWPERVGRIAMLSSPPRLGGAPAPSFDQARREWYHWFQATGPGARAVAADPKGFARVMWRDCAPESWFEPAMFERVARSFENPDWVAVTLHSYRSRWGEAEPDPRSAWLARKVLSTETLALPALYVQGERDGVNPPSVSEGAESKFTGPFRRVVLPGVGHFPTREAPDLVARMLVEHFRGLG